MWGIKKVRTYPWCKMRGVVSQIYKKFSLNQPRMLRLLVTDGHTQLRRIVWNKPLKEDSRSDGDITCLFYLYCRNQCVLWESGAIKLWVWCKVCGLKHLDTLPIFFLMNFHSEWHTNVWESAIDNKISSNIQISKTQHTFQPKKRFNRF